MITYEDAHMPLGKTVSHSRHYDSSHLFAISRQTSRESAGVVMSGIRFYGMDVWNAYELSWLSISGKPCVAMAEIRIPADSPSLVESKSLKLYLNTFNMTPFKSPAHVEKVLTQDFGRVVGAPVEVRLIPPEQFKDVRMTEFSGTCIDDVDLRPLSDGPAADCLQAGGGSVRENLFTRLFRSVCPVTGQPDWAAVGISYIGPRIDPQGLLTYWVSFREHAGFHETCVERIFCDLLSQCKPSELKVMARFTRRGGVDINPIRSTFPVDVPRGRDPRQ